MIRSGQAPIQMPHRRQRSGLNSGVPFSSSLMVPKGHSSVQRLHWVQRWRKKSGIGGVAGPRVDRLAAFRHLDALDRLHGRAESVFRSLHRIHRCVDRSGGVDAGATGLVWEADEVRVREPVLECRQVGTLTIIEVEDLGSLMVLEFLGSDRGFLANLGTLAVLCLVAGVDELADELAVGRLRNHAHGEDDEVGLNLDLVTEQTVGEVDRELAVGFDLVHVATGHHHLCRLLDADEEVLHVARSADVFVDHRALDGRIELLGFRDLAEGVDAALRGAVLQVVFVARAGALDKRDPFGRLAVGGTCNGAVWRASTR